MGCIVFKHLYSAASGVNCSEALPVCKVSWEKKVFRKAKEDERLPERKVESTEGESAFQGVGPIEAKDGDWAKAVLLRGTKRSSLFKERSGRLEETELRWSITSTRYFGARPRWALKIRVRILNCIRARRGSQCSSSNVYVEMWEYRGKWAISPAAVLRNNRVGERRTLGKATRMELQ